MVSRCDLRDHFCLSFFSPISSLPFSAFSFFFSYILGFGFCSEEATMVAAV
jgi:hypothetical protein